ncbi:MAG TPA: tetratricopeptide repeat protein [Terracidiphilus sp.]|jgi:TolA-binding protein
MLRSSAIRNRLLAAAALVLLLAPAGVPAHAVSKEIVALQTQVQQLLDMVQRLQSTVDTRFGVVQNLAQQTADAANQMTAAVGDLQKKLNAQNDALSGKLDAASGQAQSLNDSVDELKTRIDKLNKAVQDLQTQLQNIQSPPPANGAMPGGMPGAPVNPAPGGETAQQAPGFPQQQGGFPAGAPGAAPAPQAPPLQETFQAGVRDYNAARYQVAASEFGDVVHYYPLDDLAGTAQFYLGEIAYQQHDYAKAITYYDAILSGFAGNAKAPAAQLHKGEALLAQNKRDSAIHEFRLLIQRHPQTPEAARARSKLNGMGVRISGTTSR